jgi:hypothetical protein
LSLNNDTASTTPRIVNNLVRIYPNPVSGILNIEAKKEMRKPLRIVLYDLTGKMVKETTSYQNKFSVDISSLHKGIYTFKLYNAFDVEMQVEKIIKL